MAVDNLIAFRPDEADKAAADAEDIVPAENKGGDPHLPGLLGEGALPEAHQLDGNGLAEAVQQAQHVGFRPAGVAAAD